MDLKYKDLNNDKITDSDITNKPNTLMLTLIDKPPDLTNYKVNNLRTICSIHDKNTCLQYPHCSVCDSTCNSSPNILKTNKACKFAVTKYNLINHINKITYELLYDNTKMNEILNIDNYFVSDIKNYDVYTTREKQYLIKSDNRNIGIIMEDIFGKNNIPIIGKRRVKKFQKELLEENLTHLMSQLGNNYYQLVVNDNASLRAYTNGFYWLMKPTTNIEIRNLGYNSQLQTDLSNYFRSLVFDWIINPSNIKKLLSNKILSEYEYDNFYDDYFIRLNNGSPVYLLGVVELYVMNIAHNIPIAVYDQYDTLIFYIKNGIINDIVAQKEEEKIIKIRYVLNSISLSSIPNKVYVIYNIT